MRPTGSSRLPSLVQLALDFFAPALPADTPDTVASQRPASPAPAPAADGFTHAQANRHALLQGVTVSYRFERSRRKSIGFTVGPEGLVVRAPGWVPMREVDAAVQEKAAWILAKLQQMRERARLPLSPEPQWVHGADLPYLGGTVRLCVVAHGQVPQAADLPEGVQPLALHLPPEASAQQLREAAEAWFKQRARALFEERLRLYGPRLGVQHRRLSLSSARTRWGSCSTTGRISLNCKLLFLPRDLVRYVIWHELCHLLEPNHSERFWMQLRHFEPAADSLHGRMRDAWKAVPSWAQRGTGLLL